MEPRELQMFNDKDRNLFRLNVTNGRPLYFHEIHSIQYSIDPADTHFCSPKYKVDKVITGLTEEGYQKRKLEVSQEYESGLPPFTVEFTMVRERVIRVEIDHSSSDNSFKVTDKVFNPDVLPLDGSNVTTDISTVLNTPKENETFYFEIHEYNNPSNVLYSTKDLEFVHTPYYMKTTANINSNGKIFGLGERVGEFFLDDGIYTLWAQDQQSPVEDGKRPGKNVYGTHPVYFSKLKSGNDFFAVFENNAGAQDFILESTSSGKKITHIKTSGVTDMFVILNSDIKNVTKEFINLVGLPAMVPEWALGWHQSRFGYNSTEQVQNVVNNYTQNQLPLDAIWTDIDYMDMYKDFTVSDGDFADLPDAVKSWKDKNIKFIPTLSGAVAAESDAASSDVFIKDPVDQSSSFLGKSWPGDVVYVDWLKDNAQSYWVSQMKTLHDKLDYDGMWINMNEASNFCDGSCSLAHKKQIKDPIQDYLFYTPGARNLNTKSVSIDAVHSDGTKEFEAHSLYGFYMSMATSNFFTESQKSRPFVITRSSFTGVGKYASHWLGENFSTYQMLKYSVGGIYQFNFFGVPVTGADI